MIEVAQVSWAQHADTLRFIREAVFVAEQGVPVALEYDGEDELAYHWLLWLDKVPVGCVRMLGDGHIGRFAILRPYRHRGLGRRLMRALLADPAATRMAESGHLHLNAQTQAIAFYQKFGFVVTGDEFDDAGLPHRAMRFSPTNRVPSARSPVVHSASVLGSSGGRFAVRDIAGQALDLARQSRRHLRLLSLHLEPDWFDRPALAQALSALARRHRSTEVRLLVADSRPLAGRSHALVNLSRRLSSSVLLRRAPVEASDLRELFLVADNQGLLCWAAREPERAWADYHNRPAAEDAAIRFDELWYRATDDPELREIHL